MKTQTASSSKHQREELKDTGLFCAGWRVRAKELGHGYLICSPLTYCTIRREEVLIIGPLIVGKSYDFLEQQASYSVTVNYYSDHLFLAIMQNETGKAKSEDSQCRRVRAVSHTLHYAREASGEAPLCERASPYITVYHTRHGHTHHCTPMSVACVALAFPHGIFQQHILL